MHFVKVATNEQTYRCLATPLYVVTYAMHKKKCPVIYFIILTITCWFVVYNITSIFYRYVYIYIYIFVYVLCEKFFNTKYLPTIIL